MRRIDTTLYFITDSTGWDEDEFLRRVELSLMGGATIMQLREKNRTTREYMALAEKVHTLAKKYQVPLIIDDRVDVALAVDAEGVHVGQSDLPVSLARSLMGEDKIVGATTKTVAQAQEAYEQGADYLGVRQNYVTYTGTSAAAAVTAGAVAQIMQWALVQQNDPVMSNAAIKNMLIRGAKRSDDRGYPNREWGYGALDVYQAFEYLRL